MNALPDGLPPSARRAHWTRFLAELEDCARVAQPLPSAGTLSRVTGLVLEARGVRVPVGSVCQVHAPGQAPVAAEVVGFDGDRAFLMPTADVHGLASGARVQPRAAPWLPPRFGVESHPWRRSEDRGLHLPMGDGLLGRVVDSHGEPLDRQGPIEDVRAEPMQRRPINAMDRDPVREPLDTGVRAINTLLTVGRGQRIGLFAGTGVGKSVLLGMMARYTAADVIVVGLIGERGREVKEFIEDILGDEGRARSVVVAAPADAPPLVRMQGAGYATAIAEHFRDQGLQVLLLMDSLTRFAQAQREIGLAIGEPPATKGYPPSVFSRLPQLIERAGTSTQGSGSITGFYTVLAEGDDENDPIVDAARAVLDGHIMLSRTIAESGIYPPVDPEASISRSMNRICTPRHLVAAQRFREIYAYYQRHRDLITVGAYRAGTDPQLDRAVQLWPRIEAFLRQDMHQAVPMEAAIAELEALVNADALPQ